MLKQACGQLLELRPSATQQRYTQTDAAALRTTTLHYTTQHKTKYKTRRDKEVTRRDETTRRTAVGRISPGCAGRSEGVLRYRSVVTRSRLPRYLR